MNEPIYPPENNNLQQHGNGDPGGQQNGGAGRFRGQNERIAQMRRRVAMIEDTVSEDDDSSLAWTYLFAVAIIFVGLVLLARSCGTEDRQLGGVETTDSESDSGDADTTLPTQPTTTQATPSTEPAEEVSIEDTQTKINELLVSKPVQFGANESTISDSGALEEIAGLISSLEVSVKVEGHTDVIGEADTNETLSEERAAAVKAELESLGVENAITSIGLGESEASASEDASEEELAKDRKIVIEIEEA